MDTIKNSLIGLLLLVLLAGGAYLLTRPEGQPPLAGVDPNIQSAYLKWGLGGGVRQWAAAVPLSTGTTTVCSIEGPAATSTLVSGGIRFAVSSSTVSLVTLAKGARDTNATTTKLGDQITVATSSQDTIVASTTATQLEQEAHIFGPYERFTVSMQASVLNDTAVGTYSPTGICHATFEEFVSY